jgi:hypothetical protein
MTTRISITPATFCCLVVQFNAATIPLRVRKDITPVTRCEALTEIGLLPFFWEEGIPLMSGKKNA